MEVIPVTDLPKEKAMAALKRYRKQFYNEELTLPTLEEVYDKVGGRLSFLNRVAKSPDIVSTCNEICRDEKTWFLNKCWILGKEMDDDVMDEQKYSVCACYFESHLRYLLTLDSVCCHGPGQSSGRP